METPKVITDTIQQGLQQSQGSTEPKSNLRAERWVKLLNEQMETLPLFWSKLNIPKRFQGCGLNNFKTQKPLEIQRLVKAITENKSIFLTGDCGVGKTHLAIGLMYEWVKKNLILKFDEYDDDPQQRPSIEWKQMGGVPKFGNSAQMFAEIKDTFGGKYSDKSEMTILDEYIKCPVLVFDDIGVEKNTDWTRQDLYLVINGRYQAMRPTIVTCNKGLHYVSEQIDDRIASRLSEVEYIIEGKDMRPSFINRKQ